MTLQQYLNIYCVYTCSQRFSLNSSLCFKFKKHDQCLSRYIQMPFLNHLGYTQRLSKLLASTKSTSTLHFVRAQNKAQRNLTFIVPFCKFCLYSHHQYGEVRGPFFRGIPTVGQFYRGVTLSLSLLKIHSCGDIYGHGNASLGIRRFRYQLYVWGHFTRFLPWRSMYFLTFYKTGRVGSRSSR